MSPLRRRPAGHGFTTLADWSPGLGIDRFKTPPLGGLRKKRLPTLRFSYTSAMLPPAYRKHAKYPEKTPVFPSGVHEARLASYCCRIWGTSFD
jgi:hypothetical protein